MLVQFGVESTSYIDKDATLLKSAVVKTGKLKTSEGLQNNVDFVLP